MKEEAKPNDLFARLAKDPKILVDEPFLNSLLDDPSRFVGAAPLQVKEFLKEHVDPVLKKHKGIGKVDSKLSV